MVQLDYEDRQAVRAQVKAFNERTLTNACPRCIVCGSTQDCAHHPGVCCDCIDAVYKGEIEHACAE